jgi:hypothetical protein
MEQMMEHLLAKMDTNQAKTDTTLKEMKEVIRTSQGKADTNLKGMKE